MDNPTLSLPPGTTPPAARRRRGAQPGNANALKHSFYARSSPSSELGGLKDLKAVNLTDEIDMLRLVIRRLIDRYSGIGDLDQEMRYITSLSSPAWCASSP